MRSNIASISENITLETFTLAKIKVKNITNNGYISHILTVILLMNLQLFPKYLRQTLVFM